MNKIQKFKKSIFPTLLVLVIINLLGSSFYFRFDLTQDKRYTISQVSENILSEIEAPIKITVFLDSDLPPEFRRLRLEIEQLLRVFSLRNENIKYQFINPLDESESSRTYLEIIQTDGLRGMQIKSSKQGQSTIGQLYPWALIELEGERENISLLKNRLGSTKEEFINNSIQNLEYSFLDGFRKIISSKDKKIAIIKGNNELEDIYIADLLTYLKDYYFLAPFTLDSVATSPRRTLHKLKEYDLIIIAKPEIPFTVEEKYLLDQYFMNGGKSIWLLDLTKQEIDATKNNTLILPMDLNLDDLFFNYGIRFNRNLLKDIYAAPIALASGDNRNAQYEKFPWLYSPLIKSSSLHPIVVNLEPIKFDYVGEIDTLKSSSRKTVILNTSDFTKLVGLPIQVDINEEVIQNIRINNEGPVEAEFNLEKVPVAVLLEGEFKSSFANRIKPFNISNDKEKSDSTKMIVVSDGDIIKNQLENGRPLELGYDKWTGSFYGNKNFIINCIDYLLDEEGILGVRAKKISIPVLDAVKANEKRFFWQTLNVLLPPIYVVIISVAYRFYRKKKYT